jgi:TOTE conflict system, Archaeo-Eukaryotic Primase domain
MDFQLLATDDIVTRYFELFANRRAYTLQSSTPDSEKGRCYYYRPKGRVSLSDSTLRSHLEGRITIGLYAINPATQRCKWVAIDADYANSLEDLLKLQWELRQDGVEAALEKSRRGGHLWIFAEQPLLARDCRVYIHSLARRLKVPVKGAPLEPGSPSERTPLADGIEVFPKQDQIPATEFGNAMRGPLGVHRGVGKRFWFYGADYTLEAQIAYLTRLKRITEAEISGFVSGLEVHVASPLPKPVTRRYPPGGDPSRKEFSILAHVTGKKRKTGRNYFTRCPSCARQGRDKSGDNLAISIADPRKYKCWAGCTKEDIRAALGCPITTRHGLRA